MSDFPQAPISPTLEPSKPEVFDASAGAAHSGSARLRTQIGLAFGGVAFVIIVSTVVANWQVRRLAQSIKVLREQHQPTTESSLTMLNGVNVSLAELRGWVLLGTPDFKEQRARVWEEEIRPSLDRLIHLTHQSTNPGDFQRRERIIALTAQLREDQAQIEALAHTPKNLPAHQLLMDKAVPLTDTLVERITEIIDAEKLHEVAFARKRLWEHMADFRGSMAGSAAHLRTFLLTADDRFRQSFEVLWEVNEEAFAALNRKRELLTIEQATAFEDLERARSEFAQLPQRLIDIRSSAEWNRANHLLATKAVPTANKLRGLLEEFAGSERQRMDSAEQAAGRQMATLGKVQWTLLAVGLAASLLLGIVLTRTTAGPINKAVEMANAIALGNLQSLPHIRGSVEAVALGRSLHHMAEQLNSQLQRSQQSERRLRLIVEASPSGLVMVNESGTILLVNSRMVETFGYSRDELIGQPVELLLPNEIHEQHARDRTEFMHNPCVYEMGAGRDLFGRHKAGHRIPVEVALNPVELESGMCVLATVVDVTERKCAEHSLARRAMESELLHRVTSLAAESKSLDECLQQCIDGVCDLIGWPVGHAYIADNDGDRIMAPTTIWHLADETKYRSFVEVTQTTCFAQGVGLPGRILQTGEPAWIDDVQEDANFPRAKLAIDLSVRGAFGFPIVVDGDTVAVLEFFGDSPSEVDPHILALARILGLQVGRVVERQRAEANLRYHAAALERSNDELSQFAYVASHDLQEPLRKVSSFCELLNEEFGDEIDGDGRKYVNYIVDGARRMRTLIQDLLSYSRVESQGVPLKEVDTNDVLKNALYSLGGAIEDADAMITHDEMPVVHADPRQLTQLFQNLIGNGIKYCEDTPTIHVGANSKGSEWLFSVADNGIGIDPQFHDRVFGIFKRLHARNEYSGTGIGLAICKRIVDRLQGKLWIESENGRGSTFFFTVPKTISLR